MTHMKSKRRFAWVLAGALLALAAHPGLASAQNAWLYEVTEVMKLKSQRETLYRSATAALMGQVAPGTSICPGWLVQYLGQTQCAIIAIADDNINLATGRGPVNGRFQVVIQGDNLVDQPELVILEGSLHGRIDLSPAVLGPDGQPLSGDEIPLGSITGRWKARGARGGPLEGVAVEGKFSGTFRLPFVLPAAWDPTQTPVYLLDPSTYQVSPVQAWQYSLGSPTVMLEITFVERP
jgi:hypothetical protein